MKSYHKTVPWADAAQQQPPAGLHIPAGVESEHSMPARPADLVADLIVPIGQAAVTGLLLGTAGALATTHWHWFDYDGEFWPLWSGMFLATTAVAWLILLLESRRLLWAIETITGLDLDGDNHRGEPQPQDRIIIVNGRPASLANRELQKQTLLVSFVARLPIKGTGSRVWDDELGRDVYNEFRDALMAGGWADWKSYRADGTPHERGGWELLDDVETVLANIVTPGAT